MDFLNRIKGRAEQRRRGTYLGERLGKMLCFVQGDQSIANQAGAAFRSDLNNELQALVTNSQGNSAPGTTYRNQFWHDTTNNVIKRRNAANAAWIVVGTLDESFLLGRASNTILGLSDIGKQIHATAGFTQTFTAAATLGDGWYVAYMVDAGSTVVLDPNGSEQIDGATTKSLVGPCSGLIFCNGSAFFTVGFAGITGVAAQSDQETGTSVALAVTPGRQKYHPSAAKAWVEFSSVTTTAISVSYGVTSLTDNGTGNTTINWTTAFSGANYASVGMSVDNGSANGCLVIISSQGTSSLTVISINPSTLAAGDSGNVNVAAFGDLP